MRRSSIFCVDADPGTSEEVGPAEAVAVLRAEAVAALRELPNRQRPTIREDLGALRESFYVSMSRDDSLGIKHCRTSARPSLM